jgi:acyl dehydratase
MVAWSIQDWLDVPMGEIGISKWFEIDQSRVDKFAEVTEHTHWLHTDPARAASEGGYPGSLAHGFLILSLINKAIDNADLRPTDSPYALNYGVDKLRFLKPMPIGDGFRIRDRISLLEVEMRDAGLFTRTSHEFEIEGDDGPAVVAEYLALWVLGA